jgi:hypothetical protein
MNATLNQGNPMKKPATYSEAYREGRSAYKYNFESSWPSEDDFIKPSILVQAWMRGFRDEADEHWNHQDSMSFQ